MARAGAVLFDLDGTLVDSAPDLAGAANELRAEHGLAPLPYERLRPMASAGARGLLGAAFEVGPGDARFDALRDAFLARYAQRLLRCTRVFDAVAPVLQALAGVGLPWGIVTNKAARFAEPLVQGLGLHAGAAALVCGDTTPHAKPHPPMRCSAGWGCRPAPAFTSATICATCRPGVLPAWRRWWRAGATWDRATRCTTGAPMPSSPNRGRS